MFEPNLLSPILHVVAFVTFFPLLPLVDVIGFVAGETGFLHFDFFLHRLRMASETCQLVMRSFQGKFGLFVMVKLP